MIIVRLDTVQFAEKNLAELDKILKKNVVVTGQSKITAEKSKQTRLEKYGTLSCQMFKPRTVKCKCCGKEFTTTSNCQVYCSGPHYGPCPICGKMVEIKDMSIGPQTCSKECRSEKIRRTNQEKYGVDCVFQSEVIKEKSKNVFQEKYGVDHYTKTDEYSNRMKQFWSEPHPEIIEKSRKSNLDRRGVEYPMQDPEVKEKAKDTALKNYGGFGMASPVLSERIRQTNIQRYGFSNPAKNEDVKKKSFQTFVEHYGEDPYHNPEIVERKHKTSLERYGTESPSQSEVVKDKVRSTVKERYGVDNAFKSEEIKKKIAESNLERYGVTNPMQNEEVKERAYQTNLLKYGHKHFKGSDADLLRSSFDNSKLDVYKRFRDDTEAFLKSYSEPPTMRQLIIDTGTTSPTVSIIITRKGLQHLVQYTHPSYVETEIIDFFERLCRFF